MVLAFRRRGSVIPIRLYREVYNDQLRYLIPIPIPVP